MSAHDFLQRTIREHATGQPEWRYVGPGYGQGLLHRIAIFEPHEVVTCSDSHGYLGTCEAFVKHFELAS